MAAVVTRSVLPGSELISTNKQTVFMLFYFYSPSKKRRLQFGPPSAADVRPLEELISDVISFLFICPEGDLLMPTDILSSPDGFCE